MTELSKFHRLHSLAKAIQEKAKKDPRPPSPMPGFIKWLPEWSEDDTDDEARMWYNLGLAIEEIAAALERIEGKINK